ncbi:MAG: ABC transporter ATP-binding protein [Promethearchaeota archaeon]
MSIKSKKNKECAISVKNLVKIFDDDVTAVDHLSLDIKKGELFGLLGANGAGKTTLINILCGLLKPTSGTATVGGYDVTENLNKVKELIGVCPQEAAVFKYLTALENIILFGQLHNMPKKELKVAADLLIEKMNLTKVSKRKAKGYSGGMIRSLNLIISLINSPEIAFLDEPTVGQDARARRETWKFIGDLKRQNKTTILTTHYIEEAEALSDRVGIIDYGQLIALGTPKELMEEHNASNLEEVFLKITGRRILEGI